MEQYQRHIEQLKSALKDGNVNFEDLPTIEFSNITVSKLEGAQPHPPQAPPPPVPPPPPSYQNLPLPPPPPAPPGKEINFFLRTSIVAYTLQTSPYTSALQLHHTHQPLPLPPGFLLPLQSHSLGTNDTHYLSHRSHSNPLIGRRFQKTVSQRAASGAT